MLAARRSHRPFSVVTFVLFVIVNMAFRALKFIPSLFFGAYFGRNLMFLRTSVTFFTFENQTHDWELSE